MRIWLSGPRILHGLVRPGISLGREDWSPRLPSYRRYELRHGLQEAAKARGETMTKEDADYCIDKALVTGLLDSNGNLNFHMRGTREEIITEILTTAKAWGQLMTCDQAERIADRAIRKARWPIGNIVTIAIIAAYCRDCVGICPWATIEPIRGRRAMAGACAGLGGSGG